MPVNINTCHHFSLHSHHRREVSEPSVAANGVKGVEQSAEFSVSDGTAPTAAGRDALFSSAPCLSPLNYTLKGSLGLQHEFEWVSHHVTTCLPFPLWDNNAVWTGMRRIWHDGCGVFFPFFQPHRNVSSSICLSVYKDTYNMRTQQQEQFSGTCKYYAMTL